MGVVTHVALILFGVAIALPPARALIRRFVYQPGEGATAEETAKDEVEYRAIADPDVKGPVTERAFGRAWYKGGIYYRKWNVICVQEVVFFFYPFVLFTLKL